MGGGDAARRGLDAAAARLLRRRAASLGGDALSRRPFHPVALTLALLLAGAARAGAAVESIEVDPRLPTSADHVAIVVEAVATCSLYYLSEIAGTNIFLHNAHLCDPPVLQRFRSRVEIGLLEPGTYTVLVEEGVDQAGVTMYATHSFVVAPVETTAELLGRFDAEVLFRDPFGPPDTFRRAHAVRLSERAAYFWFFDGDLPEVTLKMIDGRAVNGRIWLFAASTTDVEFTLRVTDRAACPPNSTMPPPCGGLKEYASPPSRNRNIIDVEAFPASLPWLP